MEHVGFIGLGNMGGRICGAIAKKEYPLTVYDIRDCAMEPFKGRATLAKDAAQVIEESDIVMMSLPSTKEVEPTVEVFLQHNIQGKIIVDLSTSYPISTRKLFEKVKEKGGQFCDIPVSGLPSDADEAKLLALFGGEECTYEALKPLVACFASRFANLGATGNGHIAKLIFNFIGLSYVNIYALAFPLTQKLGLDNMQLLELLKGTGMDCGTFRFYTPKMVAQTYDMAFALELAHKDLTYVKNLFEEYQVPAFALDGTLAMLRTGIRDGNGKKDYSACMQTMLDFFADK